MLGFFDSPENLTRYSIDKEQIIEWIYSLQTPSHAENPGLNGFKGGSFLGNINGNDDNININDNINDKRDEEERTCTCTPIYYNQGHLAMTYSALCTLITLGDDLERVNKKGIIKGLQCLQRNDGR